MIHDLATYRAGRINPFTIWFDFWSMAWRMCLPTIRIEATIVQFPRQFNASHRPEVLQ